MVKFTDDAAPSGGPAAGDKIPLVDVSDTTDDAAGSSKTDTIQNIAGAVGLTDLSNVDTDKSKTPADGDVLTYDGTDWNAEAAAGGGGGGGEWEFVGTYDNTDFSTTTLSITGLDGDTDIRYKLSGMVKAGGVDEVNLRFNSDSTSTNYRTSVIYSDSATSTVTAQFETSGQIETADGFTADYIHFEAVIWADSSAGNDRPVFGQVAAWRSNQSKTFQSTFAGSWNDHSSNLTSIQVVMGNGNSTSAGTKLALYKWVLA